MMTHASVRGCGNLFFEFDPDDFAFLLRKLEEEGYVTVEEIARVRAANPGRTLPQEVLIFEKDRAAGKIKRPGRRKLNNVFEVMMPGLAFWHYEWLHARLRRRKETVGLNGWSATRGKSWWAGTPSERALKMTLCWLDKRGLARNVSERRLANIISQQRQKVRRWSRSLT